MPVVRVLAALPFPLRVDPAPYVLTDGNGAEWELTIERVEREHPDERLVGPETRNADLAVDRHGQLAFSRATGTAYIDGAATEAELVHSFLEVLNALIELTRDILSEYWIRTVAIKDIYYLRVEVDGAFVEHAHAARGQTFLRMPSSALNPKRILACVPPSPPARSRRSGGRFNLTRAMRWTWGDTRTV